MGQTINPFGKDIVKVSTTFCGRELTIEANRIAFQANGAVTVTYGDTVVLGIVTVSDPLAGMDYFPMSIEFEEKMYAAGKISGSRFIKREGRPTEDAVLAGRLIDRPIRPLFPKGYHNEVQGVATVVSLDPELMPDIIGMIAISSAMTLAGLPFDGPVGGVRIGLIDDQLVAFPSTSDLKEKSKLDLVVAGTAKAIMMVEAGASEVSEEILGEAIQKAHEAMQPVIALQQELAEKVGVQKQIVDIAAPTAEIEAKVTEFLADKLGANVRSANTVERRERIKELEHQVLETFAADEEGEVRHEYKEAVDRAMKREVRRAILEEGIRPDNRTATEIRPLSSEVGILPRAHGSSLFTRGTTQAMNITTLAPLSYAQLVDTMQEDMEKSFIHHYNMPGYTVGEVRRMGSPGRREIGHGALAERGIRAVIPTPEEFPYTIRTVSEILSSNGSTSMASVCSSCLSLMDAGVPIKAPVSGIAMGLMTDGNGREVILSDIQGAEDFAGDMDFKVVGTEEGVTALQMDIKVHGLTPELMSRALQQAKEGRLHILRHMLTTLSAPRENMSPYAPRIEKIQINPDKIRDVIGKGGETINKIIAETGAEIDIRDGGLVMVAAPDESSIQAAIKWIQDLTAEPEIGKIYNNCRVVKIMDFGIFVEIMPGHEGLVHVSEMADKRVEHPGDMVKEGDHVNVKLTAIDEKGRLVLSMKQAKE